MQLNSVYIETGSEDLHGNSSHPHHTGGLCISEHGRAPLSRVRAWVQKLDYVIVSNPVSSGSPEVCCTDNETHKTAVKFYNVFLLSYVLPVD